MENVCKVNPGREEDPAKMDIKVTRGKATENSGLSRELYNR